MIFHKPYFRKLGFSSDMRVQNKAIIRDYDFDSYILGSSMMENTSAKEANNLLGDKWVNISMSGSRFAERAVILDYMFNIKNPKNIIYSIDLEFLLDISPKLKRNFGQIYTKNDIFLLDFYFQKDILKCAITWSESSKCIGYDDLENLIKWKRRKLKAIKLYGGFDNWIKYKKQGNPTVARVLKELKNHTDTPLNNKTINIDISKNKLYIKKYLLDYIVKNPQTNFHLVFTTYSRLFYKVNTHPIGGSMDSREKFEKLRAILKWLVVECKDLPNVKIYGFDDTSYSDNIANYRDITHHNIDMNSTYLMSIKQNAHILTTNNIDSFLSTMEQKIKDYDLSPLKEILKKASKTKG